MLVRMGQALEVRIKPLRKVRPGCDDGLRLLRIINDTQAHGQEGARADPTRAAHEAGLDVGSERYEGAMAYLIEQAALLGDEHTAFDVGDQHSHGYATYFFARRAVKLLEG
jgi:hypothetical protein